MNDSCGLHVTLALQVVRVQPEQPELPGRLILLGFPLSKEQTKARPNEALVLALQCAVG